MTSDLQTRNDPLEHGDLAALLCLDDPEMQAVAIDQLSQLGFAIHTGLYVEEIAIRLRSRTYEVIVVGENFAGSDADTNPALNEIARLSLQQRRGSFVILLGPTMESRSEMQAFVYSVDLTLRSDEAQNLKTIAGRGIVRQEEFYSAFNGVRLAARSA